MSDEDYLIEPITPYIPFWLWYLFVAIVAIAWL
jgi:hypothetical protein